MASPSALPVRHEVLGTTAEGRAIVVSYFGDSFRPARVLVVAGQHGDERAARMAARRLAAWFSEQNVTGALRQTVQLAVLANANPDGAARRTRLNRHGVDLNRDHQALEENETRAIHLAVRAIRPALVVDVHSFPSRRLHLLSELGAIDYDVMLGIPTHPAVRPVIPSDRMADMIRTVVGSLARQGFSSGPYYVFQRSGRVRASTLRTTDLRNGVALRYGAATLLVEGRHPTQRDAPEERARLVNAQEAALRGAIRWLTRYAKTAWDLEPVPPRRWGLVPIRAQWSTAPGPRVFRFRRRASGVRRRVTFHRVLDRVEVTEAVELPDAYGVPNSNVPLLNVLRRHGFVAIPGSEFVAARAEPCFDPALVAPVRLREESSRRPRSPLCRGLAAGLGLEACQVFPTDRVGGQALAVWLEPRSAEALGRRVDAAAGPRGDHHRPVLRLFRPTTIGRGYHG